MAGNTDTLIQLSDGRSLGFCELGDLRGRPVLYFHGFPGSRLEAKYAHHIAKRLGVRIISVDRPGYGLSDFKPGRTIRDWPSDVVRLADAMGLGQFAVVGASGGGPYAAACALDIPERLTSVGIVSGLGPIDAPNATIGMTGINRLGLSIAPRAPWLVKLSFAFVALALRTQPEWVIGLVSSGLCDPDKTVLRNPEIRLLFRDSLLEAIRSGSAGPFRDILLYSRPWGFRLEEILIEVHLWHGEQDIIVPPSMGRHLAQTIPRCRPTFFPDEGHFSLIVNHIQEVLATV